MSRQKNSRRFIYGVCPDETLGNYFSANDPYHRRIEELSRTIWALAQGGMKPVNWFYERARGQYADKLSQETTTLRRKQFKERYPVFTKTDLAKYENTWD